jgi:hypothetical protein
MNEELVADLRPPKKPKFVLMALSTLLLLAGSAAAGVWVYNEIALQKPLQRVLTSDSRNHAVTANVHFDGWIDTHTVVFDLSDVMDNSSEMDVFRVLLEYAKEQKDHQYRRIILAAYGQRKFVLPGEYFQQLGQEYDTQNPVYTIRTFSHHVSTMDGHQPFPEPDGGMLWILKEEMEQFTDFNKRWYLDDFIVRHKNG